VADPAKNFVVIMKGSEPTAAMERRATVLGLAILFLIIAIIAALFGFGLVAGTAYLAAKVLFFVFIVLFVIALLFSGWRRPI
jgi:uncharacterized membrane protein YtjA (UPF0391 family)